MVPCDRRRVPSSLSPAWPHLFPSPCRPVALSVPIFLALLIAPSHPRNNQEKGKRGANGEAGETRNLPSKGSLPGRRYDHVHVTLGEKGVDHLQDERVAAAHVVVFFACVCFMLFPCRENNFSFSCRPGSSQSPSTCTPCQYEASHCSSAPEIHSQRPCQTLFSTVTTRKRG